VDAKEDWQTSPTSTEGWEPRLAELYAFWLALPRAGKRLPPRNAFDPFEVPRMLGSMWMLDIEREPRRFRYRLFGTHIASAIGQDVTGQYLDRLPMSETHRATLFKRMEVSATGGLATRMRTAPIIRHAENWSEIETLILPFAADGESPDILLIGSIFYRLDGSVF
jgi:hypothetical protein